LPNCPHRQAGKPLLRKLKDGRILRWEARSEDALCTLREAFEGVDRRVGFNVELKFDDDLAYTEAALAAALRAVLEVVFEHAGGRPSSSPASSPTPRSSSGSCRTSTL